MHALALSVAIALATNRFAFLGVAAMIVASVGFLCRRPHVKRLQVGVDGRCRVWTNDGLLEAGVVRNASVFGAAAAGLTLSINDPCMRVRRLLIIGDSVDPAVFRRLRVRLRLLVTPNTASADLRRNRDQMDHSA